MTYKEMLLCFILCWLVYRVEIFGQLQTRHADQKLRAICYSHFTKMESTKNFTIKIAEFELKCPSKFKDY